MSIVLYSSYPFILLKATGRKSSPPNTAEAKNDWGYIYTAHCFQRKSYTFIFL
jgi:hypothetical protein